MPETAREYLMHRFRGDASSLRDRVSALAQGTKIPGPDATMSQRMASACEDVAQMVEAIAPNDDPSAELAALVALIPLLEQRAGQHAAQAPVRAVYAGAATRIREVQQAEASSRATINDSHEALSGSMDEPFDVDDDGANEIDDDDALFGEDER